MSTPGIRATAAGRDLLALLAVGVSRVVVQIAGEGDPDIALVLSDLVFEIPEIVVGVTRLLVPEEPAWFAHAQDDLSADLVIAPGMPT